MKTKTVFLSVVAAAIVGLVASLTIGRSAPQFVGNLLTVNNTTSNLTAQSILPLFQPSFRTAYIQHGPLANTNDLRVVWRLSLDATNYVTLFTWGPSLTNATTETVNLTFSTVQVYQSPSITTTSSITVGGAF